MRMEKFGVTALVNHIGLSIAIALHPPAASEAP